MCAWPSATHMGDLHAPLAEEPAPPSFQPTHHRPARAEYYRAMVVLLTEAGTLWQKRANELLLRNTIAQRMRMGWGVAPDFCVPGAFAAIARIGRPNSPFPTIGANEDEGLELPCPPTRAN